MTAPGQNLKINSDRLWDSLMEMAKIGPGVAGGNNRQTLTDEDAEGRALFQKWCEAAGCTMGLDQMGNMFAMREGTDPNELMHRSQTADGGVVPHLHMPGQIDRVGQDIDSAKDVRTSTLFKNDLFT